MESNDRRVDAAIPEAANLGILRPPFIYVGAIEIGLLVHFVWPVRIVPPAIGVPLGCTAVLIAMALFFWSVRTFGAAGTPVPGNRPTTAIVRTGPYRFSRNPIYLAFSLLQLGVALWVNSVWVLVTLVPAVALMSFVVIPREEHHLESRFSSDDSPYKATVRRWL